MTKILLVGPDGVGKSTISSHLAAELIRQGFHIQHLHYRPNMLFKKESTSSDQATDSPHDGPPPHGYLRSILKLMATFIDSAAFEVTSHSSSQRREKRIYIQERGWLDQAVDQTRYRLDARVAPMVTLLARLLPRANFGVALTAPTETVLHRKQELTWEEIESQTEGWRRIIRRAARKSLEVDATQPPADIARSIVAWMQA